MITLADIKSFLKIDSSNTSYDTVLQSFISRAIARIETYCNRNFAYGNYTEYFDGDNSGTLYVRAYPVNSISSIQYYDTESEAYTDLIDGSGDTILNSTIITGSMIELRKGYVFLASTEPKNIKITYTAGYKCETGTGTISITKATKSISGSNTLFLTEAKEGDIISCEGQDLKVSAVTSDTVLTTFSNANTTISAKNYSIKTVPEDLQQVAIEMTALMFADSAQGKGRLGIASENVGSQAAQSFTFKEVNWNETLNKYKDFNV